MTNRSLRAAMPLVTEFIDAVRAVFGRQIVDSAIRSGLDGQPTFWAMENGLEIGTPIPDTGLTLSQIVIGPLRQKSATPEGSSK